MMARGGKPYRRRQKHALQGFVIEIGITVGRRVHGSVYLACTSVRLFRRFWRFRRLLKSTTCLFSIPLDSSTPAASTNSLNAPPLALRFFGPVGTFPRGHVVNFDQS